MIAITGDAVATGLVQSLAHPGGNLTGSTFFFPELNTKRIQMLREALPAAKRVAVLLNEKNRGNVLTVDAMTNTARVVGIDIVQVVAQTGEDLEGAFQQVARQRCDAVVLYEDPLFVAEATRLADLANRHRLPSVGFREYALAGDFSVSALRGDAPRASWTESSMARNHQTFRWSKRRSSKPS